VGDDGVDDDRSAVGPASPPRVTLVDRFRSVVQPKPADPNRSPRATKRAIERLDDRERWICFAASALAVITGVLIYVVETENSNFRLRKGELTPQTSLVIGLVTGALLLVATLIGRRAPVGFVSLFVFLAFGTQYFAGIPFLVLAVWLLYRSYKFQKDAAATRRAAMAENPPGASSRSRGSTGRAGSTATSARSKSVPKGTTPKGPAAPEANKRFTPKRPPPPPPKPSRRERKAAQASE
jgi:hypothetical protein